mgnify:CR=1 FL=1
MDAAGEPVLLVGGGSNLVIADAGFDGTVVHLAHDTISVDGTVLTADADALAFRTEKLLDENFDKIPEDTKAPVTESIDKLKEALKGTDNDDEIKAAMEDRNQKASAMGQAIYAAAQQEAQTSEQAPADNAGDDGDTVVDAEIVDDENDSDK